MSNKSDLLSKLEEAIKALPEKEKTKLFSQQWEAQQSAMFFSRSFGNHRSNADIHESNRSTIKALCESPVHALQIIDFLDNKKGMRFEQYEEIIQELKRGTHPIELINYLNDNYRHEPETVDEMIAKATVKKRQDSEWKLTYSPFTTIPT